MGLIDCPECEGRVSSHAFACPHCGFPVLEYGQQALEDLTGAERVKTGRQRSALTHLDRWAQAYTAERPGARAPFLDPEGHRERLWLRLVSGGLAVVVVILALLLLYGSVRS